MIKNKNIHIEVTGYNKRFYIDDFPNISKGDIITISQLELSARSTLDVECICDNCNKEFLRKRRNIHHDNTFCSDKCKGSYHKGNNSIERKKTIIKKVKERIDKGRSLSYKTIKEDDATLFYLIDKYYPLNKILSDLGYSEQDSIEYFGLTRNLSKKTLSVDEIIERLNYLESINRLTTSAMRTEFDDLRLEISIKKIFGSVENCFDELGYKRDIYNRDPSIRMGRLFENTFKEILNSLNIKYEYQKPLSNGSIPDFTVKSLNVIIDTKLSSWTTSIQSDIEKYSPYCDTLIFVYLREGSVIPSYAENVKLVSVYDYLNKLPENEKLLYTNKLNDILSHHP